MRNHELKPETNNFEDIYDYYAIFDNDLSRISPYSDVEACYKTQGSKHRQKSLLYHPDNNQDKTSKVKVNADQQYWETQETMEKLREAYNCFTGVTAEGCSGRMLYNKKCDQVIMTWEFNAGYDSDAAKENFKVSKRSDKRRTTLSKTSIMTHNKKCIDLFQPKTSTFSTRALI